jgi:hypothetical protein
MRDSVRLDEKWGAVAVTSWGDRLYLAGTGSDWHVNVAYSPDGREIMGKQWLAQRSYGFISPRESEPELANSLAGSGDHLCLAWTGSDHHINLLANPERYAHPAERGKEPARPGVVQPSGQPDPGLVRHRRPREPGALVIGRA